MQKSTDNYNTLNNFTYDLHHHLARLALLIQEYLFSVKKVIRTNIENSAEVELLVTSLIYFCLFKFKGKKLTSFFTVFFIYTYSFCLELKKTINVI